HMHFDSRFGYVGVVYAGCVGMSLWLLVVVFFFFKQKTAYEIGLGIPAEPLFRSDAKGEPLKATSYMAVGFYVAKYVNKKSDMDLAAKGLGAKEWNNSLKTKLSLLPKKLFRIRMSRNFGMK